MNEKKWINGWNLKNKWIVKLCIDYNDKDNKTKL
jgi:hypothetical protein